MFNQAELIVEFEAGSAVGNYMHVTIVNNNYEQTVVPDSPGKYKMGLPIELPETVQLKFSNKTVHDTLVDKNNQVTADTYIKIIRVSVDGFPLSDVYLQQKILLITESNDQVYSNYIGFNGTVDLVFDRDTVLGQVLTCNK